MVRKKSLSELEKAEIRLESLLEKRDALNREAHLLRQERDLVHEKKRELGARFRELKDARAGFVGIAREHRAKRDAFQGQAKVLIEAKRKLRGKVPGPIGDELRNLKRQIAQMEMRQQTASLSLSEENALLDDLKKRTKRLHELEGLKADQDEALKEVRDVDASITDLFASADREHEAATESSEKARALDAEIKELVGTITTLASEGDAKHEAYLEAKTKADDVHAKIVEMRSKVLAERGARRAEAREGREMIRAQNQAVKRVLYDKEKIAKYEEEALSALLKKGRVEIGR